MQLGSDRDRKSYDSKDLYSFHYIMLNKRKKKKKDQTILGNYLKI